MLRKIALALAAVVSITSVGIVGVTPAEAGYWYHGTWFPITVPPRKYHCHWEVRVHQTLVKGHLVQQSERVQVCTD